MYSAILLAVASAPNANPCQAVVYIPNGCHSQRHHCHNCHGRRFFHGCHGRSRGCHGYYVVPQSVVPSGCQGGNVAVPAKSGEKLPLPKGGKASGLDSARISVQVPADAKLFVDGQPTQSTEGDRLLVTPPLAADETHTYTLRAEIIRDGRVVTDIRTVTVVPGQTASVSILQPEQLTVNQ